MTLHIIGKISIQDTVCEKCRTSIKIWKKSDRIKCKKCGSLYILQSSDLGDQHIEYIFQFHGFGCVYSSSVSACTNLCPVQGMFCKEHISEDAFKSANNSVFYASQRLSVAEAILEQMKESKKIYLIQEVSGINEQDDSIWKH